jgi:hypothetical protein
VRHQPQDCDQSIEENRQKNGSGLNIWHPSIRIRHGRSNRFVYAWLKPAASADRGGGKKKAVRIPTALSSGSIVPRTIWALRPANTHEGVAPHSFLARHFSRATGARCRRRAFRFTWRQRLPHMSLRLGQSNRHPHYEHDDSKSLKHRSLPRFIGKGHRDRRPRLQHLSVATFLVGTPCQTDAVSPGLPSRKNITAGSRGLIPRPAQV